MPFKVTARSSEDDLTTASDDHLFEAMKDAELNPEKAQFAWTEFYKRYSSYLWNCCLKVCHSVTEGDDLAKDVFQSTIKKIYLQAKTYRPEKAVGIKAWISRIAYNEFIDYYNKYNAHFVPFDAIEEDAKELPEEPIDQGDDLSSKLLTVHADQLKSLLSSLSGKEFKILMTYMKYYQIDKPNAHLPDGEIEQLCKEFNIKADAIRQVKRRTILKLQKLVKDL